MTLHPSIQELVNDIEAFRAATGMTVTGFGRAAVGDGNFLPDLSNGRQPSLTLIDRVRSFMQSQRESAA